MYYYPVNFLRNVALNNTDSEYVFQLDVDLVPGYDCYRTLVRMLRERPLNQEALVVPAFDYMTVGKTINIKEDYYLNVIAVMQDQGFPYFPSKKDLDKIPFPKDKNELLDMWDKNTIEPFKL